MSRAMSAADARLREDLVEEQDLPEPTTYTIPLPLAVLAVVAFVGLAIGLYTLAASSPGAGVGLLLWALAIAMLSPAIVTFARARRAGRVAGREWTG